jgi:hypothetical protein
MNLGFDSKCADLADLTICGRERHSLMPGLIMPIEFINVAEG